MYFKKYNSPNIVGKVALGSPKLTQSELYYSITGYSVALRLGENWQKPNRSTGYPV